MREHNHLPALGLVDKSPGDMAAILVVQRRDRIIENNWRLPWCPAKLCHETRYCDHTKFALAQDVRWLGSSGRIQS